MSSPTEETAYSPSKYLQAVRVCLDKGELRVRQQDDGQWEASVLLTSDGSTKKAKGKDAPTAVLNLQRRLKKEKNHS